MATVDDVHELALAMPHVTVDGGSGDNPVYQVGGKSFVFFRNPRPDAVDPDFTTKHFDGHPSVLVRASRLGELSREELVEIVQDAWLSRASARRAAAWLNR
ncbi:hypothetical protein [Cryptosporangium phraense]|uniref:MmcQ/YjbR family DNA-binding protein n=1 Tax=Cryptosporangium phraense TaxID=2593070 RepID=A0A545AXQ1_9ACTN|nr:hypothetical protein [Cryptosporangium phraense]TQS46104.1 hypothetical protein FL583_06375 [Cryptosporangium phraense]